jgi:hypothetical protein
MASGLLDEKYYSPLSIVTRVYFDNNLKECYSRIRNQIKQDNHLRPGSATQLLHVLKKSNW